MDALLKVVDPNQLTPDLEGTLQYDHATWIDLRCVSIYNTFHYFCHVNIPSNNHNHRLSNQTNPFFSHWKTFCGKVLICWIDWMI